MPAPKSPAKKDAPRIAVVVSRYNASVTDLLLEGAIRAACARGLSEPEVYPVPGAFELPVVCDACAKSGRFDGVVALGCLIRGETIHDRVIADSVAEALQRCMLNTGIPVAFGLLTVNTPRQARERAGGSHGNKGREAMDALLDTCRVLRSARTGVKAEVSRKLPDKAGPRPRRTGRARR